MLARFSEQASQAVVLAQDEARALTHNYIGTEHLLLGLLRAGESVAAAALGQLGVTLDGVRDHVLRIIGCGTEELKAGMIPFTPRAKKALEQALREALGQGLDELGAEHVLLGLLHDEESIAAQILLNYAEDLGVVRGAVMTNLVAAQRPG